MESNYTNEEQSVPQQSAGTSRASKKKRATPAKGTVSFDMAEMKLLPALSGRELAKFISVIMEDIDENTFMNAVVKTTADKATIKKSYELYQGRGEELDWRNLV